MTGHIRVVIIDDQMLVRAGLRMILEAEDDIEIVGEAGDGQACLDIVRAMNPDVALMDIRMPVLDGVQATQRLTGMAGIGTRVLVLTTIQAQLAALADSPEEPSDASEAYITGWSKVPDPTSPELPTTAKTAPAWGRPWIAAFE